MSEQRPDTVSFETARQHYGVWRWRLERDPIARLTETWAQINAAQHLDDRTRAELLNVAWAIASLERAYAVLGESLHRAERARSEGVPAVMAYLSGPYQGSLDYLLGASIWLDFGDVLVAFRTVADRLAQVKRPVRKGTLPIAVVDLEARLVTLDTATLPAFTTESIRELADTVLHHAWHPAQPKSAQTFSLHFAPDGTVDLAPGLADELFDVVSAAVTHTTSLVRDLVRQ